MEVGSKAEDPLQNSLNITTKWTGAVLLVSGKLPLFVWLEEKNREKGFHVEITVKLQILMSILRWDEFLIKF